MLFGQRVAADGNAIDPVPVRLAYFTAIGAVSLDWNGSEYLIAAEAVVGPSQCNVGFVADPFQYAIRLDRVTRGLAGDGGRYLASYPSTCFNLYQPRIARARDGWIFMTDDYASAVRLQSDGSPVAPGTRSLGRGHPATALLNGEWYVLLGPYGWPMPATGAIGEKQTLFPFVPEGADSRVVTGGPAPLVMFRTAATAADPQDRLLGRFLPPPRLHAVRH